MVVEIHLKWSRRVGVSQGTPSEGLSGQSPFGHNSVSWERSPRCVCPDQLVVVFRLQLPQPEGNTLETWGGDLTEYSRVLTPDRRLPLPRTCFLSVLVLFSFHGVFLKEAWFSPEGRWWCLVSFEIIISGDFRSGIFHCGASVLLSLQSTVVVFTLNFHRCNLPDHIPSSLPSSYSFLRLIFLDPLSPSKQDREFALSLFFLRVLPRVEELLRSRS